MEPEERLPQAGDVVVFKDPRQGTDSQYDPPPYVIVDIHDYAGMPNAFLRNLDGSPLRYCQGLHTGVRVDGLRVDVFLTAARRACAEKT